MKKYLTILAITVGASLVGAVSAQAQLFAYDGFSSYPTGLGTFGGSGGSGDWKYNWYDKSSYSFVSGSDMSYSTLPTSGSNSVLQDGTSGTTQLWRVLGSNFGQYGYYNTSAPGTLWMSYLWAGDSTGAIDTASGDTWFRQASVGFYSGGNASSTAGSEMLDIGMPNISGTAVGTVLPEISLWDGGHGLPSTHGSASNPDLQSGVAANNFNQNFIIIEMLVDQNSLTPDTMNVWINPTLGVDPTTLTPNMSYTIEDLSRIDTLRMSANNPSSGRPPGTQQFDEIRLGTDYTSVETLTSATLVPEPASMALLGLGSLGLLLFRRRK